VLEDLCKCVVEMRQIVQSCEIWTIGGVENPKICKFDRDVNEGKI
jgi:hypothetical protein